MPQETTAVQEADADGQRLIHELQEIRDRLGDHAARDPRRVDFRSAREDVRRATEIAIKAGSKPYSESAANLWLGYIIDHYAEIVRKDAAVMAQRIFGV